MTRFFIGVDLGQSRDHTAIAIIERAEFAGPWDPVAFAYRKLAALRLRYLERTPLGTPYPEIVDRVRRVARSAPLEGRCCMAVDATGVGRPVVDLLRRAGLGCRLFPVLITAGDSENQGDDGYFRVPKRDLVIGLQVLLQQGDLQIAAGLEDGPALVDEMAEMQVKVTLAGKEQYGVWREGRHDDLVFAVSLACWAVKKLYPSSHAGPVGWCASANQAEWIKEFKRLF